MDVPVFSDIGDNPESAAGTSAESATGTSVIANENKTATIVGVPDDNTKISQRKADQQIYEFSFF